ncbi:MAG: UV DNA damage repair endonuclease UvsE [Desulfobulbaceae bacterium]|uniref:UV DNA damage repair endonuclease UvsE n=1 Tax=Candidatus Desulfobia pelagia TaxID=2841692 RepID=A0A8J6TGQ1_9BACT|nr:UV DNA damage repair endonuclease UvsE [Candidatus Desulfobia pelagia]
MKNAGKLRFGLCCIFRREPIKFRQVTAKTLLSFSRVEQLLRLAEICLHNVNSLKKALSFVAENGIGAFRILSPLFPRLTHPQVGYQLDELPGVEIIRKGFEEIRRFRQDHDIRLSFHPDQFNVLSSNREQVIRNTNRELAYHGMLADLVDAEVVNIHAGGVYGNKESALERLKENIEKLSFPVRSRLTLENDDVSYSPKDLLPVCESLGIPMVYDVHHHRCLPDGLSEAEVTERVVSLWRSLGREPCFHISSPRNGWDSRAPKPHADYIDPADFPSCWTGLTATVDVEAKAKELAVIDLQKELGLHSNKSGE